MNSSQALIPSVRVRSSRVPFLFSAFFLAGACLGCAYPGAGFSWGLLSFSGVADLLWYFWLLLWLGLIPVILAATAFGCFLLPVFFAFLGFFLTRLFFAAGDVSWMGALRFLPIPALPLCAYFALSEPAFRVSRSLFRGEPPVFSSLFRERIPVSLILLFLSAVVRSLILPSLI